MKEVCIICACNLFPSEEEDEVAAARSKAPDVSALPCGHVFHRPCIEEWLRRNPVCPNCKRPVEQKVDKLYFNKDDEGMDYSEVENLGEDQRQQKEEEEWKKEAFTFGLGAFAGLVAAGVLGLLFGGKKRDNRR